MTYKTEEQKIRDALKRAREGDEQPLLDVLGLNSYSTVTTSVLRQALDDAYERGWFDFMAKWQKERDEEREYERRRRSGR